MHTQHTSGFTFIELIITLSVIAILAAWGFPEYREFRNNQVMTQSLNRLSAVITFARSQSIIRSEQVVVCPSTGFADCETGSQWHLGWMVFADLDGDRTYDGQQDVLLLTEQGMPEGITALSARSRSKIRFNNLGFSPGTNLTIRFCDERGAAHGKAIVVSNVGRPRVTRRVQRCG
jgi:type IV fimbrial biogenesis protein FimT